MMIGNLGLRPPAKLQLIQGDLEPNTFPCGSASVDNATANGFGLAELKGAIDGMAEEIRMHFRAQAATLATLVHEKAMHRPDFTEKAMQLSSTRKPCNSRPEESHVDTLQNFSTEHEGEHGVPTEPEPNYVMEALRRNLAGFPDCYTSPGDDDIIPPGRKRRQTIKVKKGFLDSLEAETQTHNAKADMKRANSMSEVSSACKSNEEATTLACCPTAPTLRHPRKFLRWMISQRSFESFVMGLILVNVIIVGIEVDTSARLPSDDIPMVFETLDRVFTVLFSLELTLKICVLGCWDFFNGPDKLWNFFDILIVSLSVLELLLSVFSSFGHLVSASHLRMLRVLRLARAFRGIRAMRLLRFIASLRTLMHSIVNTLRSLAWTVLLLVMIFYIFGVAFTQAISDHCRDEAIEAEGDMNAIPRCSSPEINTQWLSLPRSMLTLFKSATNGIAWQDVTDPLLDVSIILVVVFILYFAFTFFAVLNVVTGVFCHTAIESANSDKDIAIRVQLAQQKTYVKAIKGMFRDIDTDGSNSITIDEFERTLDDESMKAYLASIDVDTIDAWTLFSLIDKDMSGCIDVEEFVTGCLNLRGPAKALHIAKMSYENKHMRQMMKSVLESNASLHAHLDALTSRLDLPDLEREEMAASNPALHVVPATRV
eukprot:TRINITY_DN3382_c0_g2_i1.p1 TRINITY_DN3382_c0_g2~~TRINITY_DN3382_c0_g2_i1.p1  ORF type:complete len:655 (-),score=91.15 TRINITY_DN3382_c0_g2_i1:442-2406(-)